MIQGRRQNWRDGVHRRQKDLNSIQTRLQELEKACAQKAGKAPILVLRGFPSALCREFLQSPWAVLPAEEVLDEEGWLRPEAVAKAGEQLPKLLETRDGPALLLYEQLLAVAPEALPEKGRVWIVENDLFPDMVPCLLPPERAAALCAGLQTGEISPEEEVCLTFYGDVQEMEPGCWAASLLNCHTETGYPQLPFYGAPQQEPASLPAQAAEIPASGRSFFHHRLLVQEGNLSGEGRYLLDNREDANKPPLQGFFRMLEEQGQAYGVDCRPRVEHFDGTPFLPLLQKYWGKDAAFRPLEFYASPEENREAVTLSQGDIVGCIARQCDRACAGESFRNIFVTAPTGAGKSILFQLPALYLAEKYQAVTIVVTPLKALMKDQVYQLEKKQGVTCATSLHSDITYEERQERLQQIHNGEKSIVYLSPELLISSDLSVFIGDRPLGLFVVDEAHTVTSWGKDFRADYWYLGEYLSRLAREGRRFPVLCLTATAVYGGEEDVVNETIASLGVERPLLYLGRVRRKNIAFDIRRAEPQAGAGSVDKQKIQIAAQQTREFVAKGEKTLFYFPYTSQVDETYTRLESETRRRVRKFHSRMQSLERNLSQLAFQKNDCDVMLSTKAFGMGVDISDIQTVCHFAPTGNLADYVQEIGRAARRPEIQGRAVTAFLPSDVRYMSTLYNLSELRQFQIREILRKVTQALRREGKRHITLFPDEFSYLFPGDDDSLQNKVKNGLLLLGSDLEKTYGFPVLRMLASDIQQGVNYVNVPEPAERTFLKKYGQWVSYQPDDTRLVIRSRNRFFASDTVVRNSGKIYQIDMGGLWRGCFQEMNYQQFKRQFFAGELFDCPGDQPLAPRSFISVRYRKPFMESMEDMRKALRKISGIFREYKLQKRAFTLEEFRQDLQLGDGFQEEFAGLLLDMFVTTNPQRPGMGGGDKSRFIAFRKGADGETGSYRVLNTGYLTLENQFMHLATQAEPDDEGVYQAYILAGRSGKQPAVMRLFSLLELLGIASYSMEGGRGQEISLFAADPALLDRVLHSTEKYENRQIQEIHRRHGLAVETMEAFLSGDYTSEARWDMIEEYFLGRSFLGKK